MRRPTSGLPGEASPYLDGALGRLETGQPLRAVDLQELSYAIGREAALKLERASASARSTRTAPAPRGFWAWLVGPAHQAPEPLPAPLARMVQRLRSGARLDPSDTRQLARAVGRAGTRAIARRAARGGARPGRRVSRRAGRRSTR